jgi:hypothetical protein
MKGRYLEEVKGACTSPEERLMVLAKRREPYMYEVKRTGAGGDRQ